MDTLFHYCSTEAFVAMMRSKEIWLSSLAQSNDSSEGRIVRETLRKLAHAEGIDRDDTEKVLSVVEQIEVISDGLGFCLSQAKDLLSQWRGYADDGRGVAVGFNVSYLKWLAAQSPDPHQFSLERVRYEPTEHETEVRPTYERIRELLKEGVFRPTNYGMPAPRPISTSEQEVKRRLLADQLADTIGKLFLKFYVLKSPAFQEEQEWRLLSNFMSNGPQSCEYRVRSGNRILPFRKYPMLPTKFEPVSHVVLGPKHQTSASDVQELLRRFEFKDVTVSRSSASYR